MLYVYSKSNAMNLDIHGNQYKPKIIMSIILLATFSGALMQTSLGTALPTLMNDFDIDFSTAQQATTWFYSQMVLWYHFRHF